MNLIFKIRIILMFLELMSALNHSILLIIQRGLISGLIIVLMVCISGYLVGNELHRRPTAHSGPYLPIGYKRWLIMLFLSIIILRVVHINSLEDPVNLFTDAIFITIMLLQYPPKKLKKTIDAIKKIKLTIPGVRPVMPV